MNDTIIYVAKSEEMAIGMCKHANFAFRRGFNTASDHESLRGWRDRDLALATESTNFDGNFALICITFPATLREQLAQQEKLVERDGRVSVTPAGVEDLRAAGAQLSLQLVVGSNRRVA